METFENEIVVINNEEITMGTLCAYCTFKQQCYCCISEIRNEAYRIYKEAE